MMLTICVATVVLLTSIVGVGITLSVSQYLRRSIDTAHCTRQLHSVLFTRDQPNE